jgi:hypothetical protein
MPKRGKPMIMDDGKYRYELAVGWGELPSGWEYGDVTGVGADSEDNVYVFTRSPHPVIVFERSGRFMHTWGEV